MKKRALAIVLAFALSAELLACGNKEGEPEWKNTEMSAAEETAGESEPAPGGGQPEETAENAKEPEERGDSFLWLYSSEITRLYTTPTEENQDSMVYFDQEMNPVWKLTADQFALLYIDDDDIPELVAVNKTDPEVNTDEFYALYTVYDGRLSLLDGDSFRNGHLGKPYFGYYDRKNV